MKWTRKSPFLLINIEIKMIDQFENLRLKLEQDFKWPTQYMFKFIVAGENIDAKSSLILLFSDKATIQEKVSSGGKYISLTMLQKMNSADSVIEIYQKASGIAGVMSL